jgi:hypothetical protein
MNNRNRGLGIDHGAVEIALSAVGMAFARSMATR